MTLSASARAHRRRHSGRVCLLIGEGSVEPGQPFPDAAPCEPQRLQRRRQRQRERGIRVFAAPRECAPQVVDLGFGPLDALLMAGARRGVAQGGHVVVAVTRPDGVGFAGLAQLFLCVLAHRLQ
jgi:hypothetical protein